MKYLKEVIGNVQVELKELQREMQDSKQVLKMGAEKAKGAVRSF